MTASARLKLLEPRFRTILTGAADDLLRRVAANVSCLAANNAGVEDPRLHEALGLLQGDRYGESPQRAALRLLIDELDAAAWDIQDRIEVGAADDSDYRNAFRKARAANAVWFALDTDPLEAAAEAIYEARASLEDSDAVWAAVRDAGA